MIPHQRCPCGGTYAEHVISLRLHGYGAELPEVPQGRCGNCGSRIYPAAAFVRLETAFKAERPGEPAAEPPS